MYPRSRIIFPLVILFLCAALCSAQESQNNTPKLQEIQKQILELQKQMQQMKQQQEKEIQSIKEEHQQEIKALKKEMEQLLSAPEPEMPQENESAYLRELAEKLAGAPEEEKSPEETVFKFRGLSLQTLNPEISATGDLRWYLHDQAGTRRRSEFDFHALELNLQSYLDPYSRLKAVVPITEDGAELEEAYYTRFGLLENVNLDLGKFRQQFGVVNRWHCHALDQITFPMALQRIFGHDGLAQTGASLDWTLPEWGGAYQGLTVQITNGENEQLFDGETLGNPNLLFHYKNYRDLTRDLYLEWGLSGLFGWNDQWNIAQAGEITDKHDALGTQVLGADLSVLWEPADQALYRNIEWRSELYFLNRDLLAPDGSGRDNLQAWGAYSYVQSKISRRITIGIRGDFYQPDSKDYAEIPDASLTPLAYTHDDAYRWQVGPYFAWKQSEWVLFRCEYNHADGRGMEKPEDILWFQILFAAGPHKHERY
jgi:hypothetical protein